MLVLAPELYLPLRNLATQFHASADGNAVATRLLDLAEEQPALAAKGPRRETALAPISFERVSFRYPTRDVDVLHDVAFEIQPGETVAVVGPSGGGKSTLVALLLRLADPSSGRILVGGEDLASVDAAAWRRLTAYVPQRPTLFRGTIADNIRLGDPAADDRRVREAAAHAGAHGFVAELSGRVRDTGRRRRPGAFDGTAAANRARARVPARRPARGPRRADGRPRPGQRGARRRGDRPAARRAGRSCSSRIDLELAERADRIVRIASGRVLAPAVEAA